MRITKRTHVTRIVAIMVVAALAVGAAPAMASALGDATRANGVTAVFNASLAPVAAQITATEKLAGQANEAAAGFAKAERRTARVQAPLPRPVTRDTAPAGTSGRTRTTSTSTTTSGTTATAPAQNKTAAPTQSAAAAPAPAPSSSIDQARAVLAKYAGTYKYVSGTTVEFGDTKGNGQAIVYYKSKRIIINPNHTASLDRIIGHEIWHIIDYHHNGQINWGESVPPSNANDFRL